MERTGSSRSCPDALVPSVRIPAVAECEPILLDLGLSVGDLVTRGLGMIGVHTFPRAPRPRT